MISCARSHPNSYVARQFFRIPSRHARSRAVDVSELPTGERRLLLFAALDPTLSAVDLVDSAAVAWNRSLRAQFDQAMLVALTAVVVSTEPAVVILGGGIARSLGPFLAECEPRVERLLQVRTPLSLAHLSDFSGAHGAMIAAFQSAYVDIGVRPERATELPVGMNRA